MAWTMRIERAKPNPLGKDKTGAGYPKLNQLLGEWVDLKNIGDQSVDLSQLHLAHLEFSAGCKPKERPVIYWNGKAGTILGPGQVARIHTGRSSDSHQMDLVDQFGADIHSYAESGSFVLNNDCGDVMSVWWKDREGNLHRDDAAGYDPNPPEGAILTRVGPKLKPVLSYA
ncbi:MAG TPA: hypothetical protein PKE26_03330 [Kiritimatiellia bacterium]|nr:hypothetical protein [Kiritimatiellia bacterium]HMO98121.1 hypothetical protein [Kiritimatiellia bacterium]HMP96178.1 hypothetical protein [Kiritimatiellia bacterium]